MTEEQKAKKKITDKAYRDRNKAKIKERDKLYYENNKEKIKLANKEYAEKNKETKKAYKEKWVSENKDRIKKYYEDNKTELKSKRKTYIERNRDKIREYDRNYRKRKMVEDPLYRLKAHLRILINKSLRAKQYVKNSKTIEILGCSYEEFKQHIESLWQPWMNWGNKGLYNGQPNYGWDIDHITPLSTGMTKEELIKLNHYTNLQPLCSYINRDVKRDNI